jgi:iron complex transport system substrate-binding protein
MLYFIKYTLFILFSAISLSCSMNFSDSSDSGDSALYFCIDPSRKLAVITDPYTQRKDSISIEKPYSRIVCMSSTHIAALSTIGKTDAIIGVSGLRYVSDSTVLAMAAQGQIKDVGYDYSFEYEAVMALNPDLILAYSVGSTSPEYVNKLRSLGFKVVLLYDHLENHPLARAEYVRLLGALTNQQDRADSVYSNVKVRYLELKSLIEDMPKKKVLLNAPYSDAWYVPGRENYMSRLISDAGGVVLGSKEGSQSSVMDMEKAFLLSQEADFWFHPGSFTTVKQLKASNPLFKDFGPVLKSDKLPYIYNNNRRQTAGGGNDFWESGSMRPDLILEDLISILYPEVASDDSLHYYIALE